MKDNKDVDITFMPLNYYQKIDANQIIYNIYNEIPELYYPWALSILGMELNKTALQLEGHNLEKDDDNYYIFDTNGLLKPNKKYTKGIEILNNIRIKQPSETKSYEYFVLEMVDETRLKEYDPKLNSGNYEQKCKDYITDFETFIGYSASD